MADITTKIALYGDPGARKTLQIKYLIEKFGADNVGIVSCEQGLGTIGSAVQAAGMDNVFVANGLDDMRRAYAWAKARYTSPSQWIAIDGGSRVFNWISQEVWQNVQRAYDEVMGGVPRKSLPEGLRKYSAFITKGDEIDSARCWITVGNNAQWLMDAWIKLPCNLYMTFWAERPNIDQYTKGPQYNLDLPGKGTRDAVVGAFDFIFRLISTGREASKAVCRSTTTSFAKSRDDHDVYAVPDEIEAFNLAEFVGLIRGQQ